MWKHGQTICINYEAVVGPDTSPPKRSLYVADVKLYFLFNLNYFSLLTVCEWAFMLWATKQKVKQLT